MTESEQRHFGVLLEQILHKVRVVAKGHSTLNEKMERFHEEAKEDHRSAMGLIKFSHDELNKKIDGVGKRLDVNINGVRTELRETRADLSARIEAVGDKACLCVDARRQVEGHEERIVKLERKASLILKNVQMRPFPFLHLLCGSVFEPKIAD